jgi:hypothetical protein
MMDQRPEHEHGREGLAPAKSHRQAKAKTRTMDLDGKMRAALRSNLLYSDYLTPSTRSWTASAP